VRRRAAAEQGGADACAIFPERDYAGVVVNFYEGLGWRGGLDGGDWEDTTVLRTCLRYTTSPSGMPVVEARRYGMPGCRTV